MPAEAIIFNRAGLSVAVVEQNRVHIRKVTLVRDMGTTVEVSEGVLSTDNVEPETENCRFDPSAALS